MRYRALDENGDMVMRNGQAYLEGVDAVRQACATRLRLLLYEWWEDVKDGIPWWQNIIATRNIDVALQLIRKRIQGTDNVLSILNMEHQWNNETRTLTVKVVGLSTYGIFDVLTDLAVESGNAEEVE